jgi:uncharacterized membrane protein YsdA (DUF1294 family)
MAWHIYLIWLGIASIITFIIYGIDKVLAKTNGYRIPELVLHLLTLSGGFPGGWLGRVIFRHKTQKSFFTFVLVISTAIHSGLGCWLLFEILNFL